MEQETEESLHCNKKNGFHAPPQAIKDEAKRGGSNRPPLNYIRVPSGIFQSSGANASAIIHSLVENTKANKQSIYQYLYTVLLYTPDYKNEPAGLDALLLWSDFVKVHCTGPANIDENTPENRILLPV